MGRSIGRAMATRCHLTSTRPCVRLNNVAPRRSADTLHLCGVCDYALQLPLLSQQPLSHLSTGCQPDLVGPPTGSIAASATLSGHLYAARWSARTRAPAPAHDLHTALSRLRRCF